MWAIFFMQVPIDVAYLTKYYWWGDRIKFVKCSSIKYLSTLYEYKLSGLPISKFWSTYNNKIIIPIVTSYYGTITFYCLDLGT